MNTFLSSKYKKLLPLPAYAGMNTSKWRLADTSLEASLDDIHNLIQSPERINPERILKKSTRRLIFIHRSPTLTLVVKAFPLDSFKKKLQHTKYADAEACNMLQAYLLDLPVPKLFGFGYMRRFSLVQWNALCMEFVDLPSMETLLNATTGEDQKLALLKKSYPLFKKIYETGCNHIDFKPGSILLGNDKETRIIDFQYVRYLQKPSKHILAAQAGHFAWDVSIRNKWLDEAYMNLWFEGLLDELNIAQEPGLNSIFTKTRIRRDSIKNRLDGLTS